jgi:hypothetical protein
VVFLLSQLTQSLVIINFLSLLQNSLRGVATDALNQKVVSGDAKGILKFWKFKTKELVGKLGTCIY